MRMYVHIGLAQVGTQRLQHVMASKREQMSAKGILFPRAPGTGNHTRLYMAVTDPDHVDPLRFNRGYITGDKQATLQTELLAQLAAEIAQHQPHTLILSASQLGTSLSQISEVQRLKDLLSNFSNDIRIIAHVDEQARLLVRHYGAQILEGRAVLLDREMALAETENWWRACLDTAPEPNPQAGVFAETQAAPFWLDYPALIRLWEAAFGAGSVRLRPFDALTFASKTVTDEIRSSFEIEPTLGKADTVDLAGQPSAAWLARGRQLNALILRLLADRKRLLPRQLWRSLVTELAIDGPAIAPGALAPVSRRFTADNAALCKAHPALDPKVFRRDRPCRTWSEADAGNGFRASQYLLSFMYRIDKASQAERKTKAPELARIASSDAPRAPANRTRIAATRTDLTPAARALMPPQAVQNFEKLKASSFAPHNRLGAVNEEELAAPFTPMPPRVLSAGSSGNVIVGCMKNEAPYIVEWVAYHRAIGVDTFLIYTNDCTDGTAEILDRLQQMGVVHHRDNTDWKGNSPQQHALNKALREPVVRNADWIIHIDVDEFMNVRTGNGTLDDFLAHVPDATNVAMTWRMFGHNKVRRLSDDFVIEQFDTCAPKYCPKPHTAWGFKTMFKNIGAYAKISCHRPNKLDETMRNQVRWVNGSGHDMTAEVAQNGWRNSKRSIGYDLLQLNHYALRSAESFLIKRQRGRALHVDRSIGINYWIRMDWSDFRDITIKRNLPRLRAEYDRLLSDDILRNWHEHGMNWHRAKAEELHGLPEFEDLYQQALKLKLTETERAAYALALDMES
ncbi:Glycosyl transferase family 2 [Sedimentitalea nanhaiensis]|uniref:Glycosyl transferase family 2 n=1 Tax=Sedimentitalea nanhaiensis TaxID=999627 RepID=A0A1I7D149_9RHOB|nr:glycosyltransferase family 2 protein [Sedimentitalea nanhaiensis]SFU05331.1 Glycosyl transferase family 2 [Sedimentitalea nanhaiensis]